MPHTDRADASSWSQVNNLREIQALRRLSPHPGIIKLCEVLYDQPTRRLALVFELMDMNIYELIRGRRHYLPESRIKVHRHGLRAAVRPDATVQLRARAARLARPRLAPPQRLSVPASCPAAQSYMYQLLKSMDHMHRNGIFHRDIKPENILITDDELKLADFGSCRGIYSKQPYTEYISTRWYRAPECLLTDGFYNYKMDMWGVGCVFFEVLSLYPLFPGTNELDQVTKIHQILGTPTPEVRARTSHIRPPSSRQHGRPDSKPRHLPRRAGAGEAEEAFQLAHRLQFSAQGAAADEQAHTALLARVRRHHRQAARVRSRRPPLCTPGARCPSRIDAQPLCWARVAGRDARAATARVVNTRCFTPRLPTPTASLLLLHGPPE